MSTKMDAMVAGREAGLADPGEVMTRLALLLADVPVEERAEARRIFIAALKTQHKATARARAKDWQVRRAEWVRRSALMGYPVEG